ncbi:MAG TPA: hypothetical protein VHO24_03785 [Opitutaceae bacterium]|nr:hypothetical protein [Opitutaceae bacterium]
MSARCPLLAVLVATFFLAACDQPKVASYRVPKEKDPEMPAATGASATSPADAAPGVGAAGPDMASTPVTTAAGPGLTWTAPSHWKPKAGSAMRKGSYAIAGEGETEADLSITAFPGNVGGELANLNRWRGQLQLPPVTEAEFSSATGHLDVNGLHVTTVDITGTGANPQRILGVMIPHGDATWFFKLLGPDTLLAREKPAFMAFLETVKPAP